MGSGNLGYSEQSNTSSTSYQTNEELGICEDDYSLDNSVSKNRSEQKMKMRVPPKGYEILGKSSLFQRQQDRWWRD